MVCKNCGVKNPDGVAACRVCGNMEWAEAEVAAPVVEPDTKTCPKCGLVLDADAKFCKNCGTKQEEAPVVVVEEVPVVEEEPAPIVAEPETKTCPKCGKELAITAKFCNGCGAKQEEEPVAVVEEVPAPVVEEEPVPVVEEVAPIVAPVVEPDTKTCPKCGKELAIKAKFCNGCGAKQEEEPVAVVEEVPAPVVEEEPAPVVEEVAPIVAPVAEPDTKVCAQCGMILAINAKFCKNCGAKQEEAPVVAVEEVPTPVVEEDPTPVVEEEVAPIVAPAAEPDTKVCAQCGMVLAINAKFCKNCGAKQEEAPAVVVEEVPTPVVEEPVPVVEEVVPAPVVEEAPTPVVEEEPAPVVSEAPVAEPDTKTCPKCGKVLPKRVKFCTGCGAKQEDVAPTTKTCAGCGKTLPLEAKFCLDCGMKQ